jgi:hypothetical protein
MNKSENRFYREPAPMDDEAKLTRLVQETFDHCAKYLRAVGISPEADVWTAARGVVWARYYAGDDGWERLKEAIGRLEQIVGRPKDEQDI